MVVIVPRKSTKIVSIANDQYVTIKKLCKKPSLETSEPALVFFISGNFKINHTKIFSDIFESPVILDQCFDVKYLSIIEPI